MRSSKSRSRSKQNRPRTLGNIINRVFDSSGPEGKVRGTPQQIIEKYQMLARDAQLSNDRVAAENFLQHAEHYTRLLAEANREMAAEQEARQQYQPQNGNPNRDRAEYRPDVGDDQPSYGAPQAFGVVGDDDSHLVDLPEAPRPQGQPRRDDRPQQQQQPRRDDNRRRDDRPRDDRPREDRPREDRPRDDRPREDRFRQEQPRQEQPRQEQPRQEQPRQEQPREDRPRDDRPRTERIRPEQARPEQPRAEQPRAERARVEPRPEPAVQPELPAFITGQAPVAASKDEAPAAAKPARAPRARKPAAPKPDGVAPSASDAPEAAE